MFRKSLSLFCVVALVSVGCSKQASYQRKIISVDSASTGYSGYYRVAGKMDMPIQGAGFGGGQGTVYAAGRFVAVRHRLEIVEPGANLPKSLEAVVGFCGSIQCEVLSSNISGTTSDGIPAGAVVLRVAPQDLNKLLDFVGKQGKISQHGTETEDKTAAVIDVEAKIKNQTEFRDSLRRMLTKPGVTVADLLQIQEKLAEAQAELDSEATQRKVLANETEKVAVEINFRSEIRTASHSVFAPIGTALSESVGVLADSLAALITAVAAIIPWLIVIIPAVWFLIKAIRKIRARRVMAKASSA
jgi:hypothetical protein